MCISIFGNLNKNIDNNFGAILGGFVLFVGVGSSSLFVITVQLFFMITVIAVLLGKTKLSRHNVLHFIPPHPPTHPTISYYFFVIQTLKTKKPFKLYVEGYFELPVFCCCILYGHGNAVKFTVIFH